MVFLDYASTNPYTKYECADYCRPFLNVNANYAFEEKKMLMECEMSIKTTIGAKSGKVIFGGTSSQLIENLFGQIGEDVMIVGSIYEHDSVARFTNQMNNIDGIKDTIQNPSFPYQLIACVMGVNNVTGRVFPVEEIGRLCKEHGAFFICDMTAMIGHASIPANLDKWCDCAFWSGHKIGTELGIGCMWLSDKFDDWLGDFKLHGTPNLAGAMAIADATEDACNNAIKNIQHWYDLVFSLEEELKNNNIKYELVSYGTPAINAIRLHGIDARALQSYLASKQMYVGLGQSSCAEENDNRVLNAFGLSDNDANEVIRISFGENSDVNDIVKLVEEISKFIKIYT